MLGQLRKIDVFVLIRLVGEVRKQKVHLFRLGLHGAKLWIPAPVVEQVDVEQPPAP